MKFKTSGVKQRPFGLGLIGAGEFTKMLLPELPREIISPKLVYDTNTNSANNLKDVIQGLEAVDSLEEFFLSDEIDGAYIVTPPHTHAALIRKCVNHNLPVICEKPLTTDSKSTRELVSWVSANGKSSAVGICSNRLLFTPQSQLAKELIKSGQLGELFAVHMNSSIPKPRPISEIPKWKRNPELSGGGLIGSWCIYELEWLRQVLDSRFQPEFINCSFDYWEKSPVALDSGYAVNISCETGLRILITRTSHIGPQQNKVTVYGRDGTLTLSLYPCSKPEPMILNKEKNGNLTDELLTEETGDWSTILSGPVLDFVEAIQTGRPVMTELETQTKLQGILDACRISGSSRSATVPVTYGG